MLSTSKLGIRFAQYSDYPRLSELLKEVFSYNVTEENYKMYCSKEENIVLVAEIENKIVGCVCCELQWNAFTDEKLFFIRNACVRKEFRRRGIYGQLIQCSREIAKAQEVFVLELTCANFRIDAQQFYLNHGFTKKDTTVFIHELEEE